MIQVNALMSALARDPSLLRRILPNQAEWGTFADLSATDAETLKALAGAVSSMLHGMGGPAGFPHRSLGARRSSAVVRTNRGSAGAGGQGVEVTALVSLLAVTGALSVLGTVSMVALSCGDRRRTP